MVSHSARKFGRAQSSYSLSTSVITHEIKHQITILFMSIIVNTKFVTRPPSLSSIRPRMCHTSHIYEFRYIRDNADTCLNRTITSVEPSCTVESGQIQSKKIAKLGIADLQFHYLNCAMYCIYTLIYILNRQSYVRLLKKSQLPLEVARKVASCSMCSLPLEISTKVIMRKIRV